VYLFKYGADWQRVKRLYVENRPLDDNERSTFDAHRRIIIDLIDPSGSLIGILCKKRCFNLLHKDYIECGATKLDKVQNLLDIVRRRSVADCKKLINALYTHGQLQPAEILGKLKGTIVEDNIGILTDLQGYENLCNLVILVLQTLCVNFIVICRQKVAFWGCLLLVTCALACSVIFLLNVMYNVRRLYSLRSCKTAGNCILANPST